MKIGITGALGFIGKSLANRFLKEGHSVRGLDIAEDVSGFYKAPSCDYVRGDIADAAAAATFSEGLDRIYHTAAIVQEAGDWNAFRKVNVTGPLTVARAAKKAGVGEFIHFSSVMVYGFDFFDGITEAGPLDGADNPYCTTKIESEAALLPLHENGKFDVYIIRPGDVYGPGSIPWTRRPVEMMKARKWIYVDAGRTVFNHVYIDNLLDGIETVVNARASGRAFNITDDRRTTNYDFFSHYQRYLGIRFLPHLPGKAALAIASLVERIVGVVGGPQDVNREGVRFMLRRGTYSCEAAKALGYAPKVSLEEGMEICKRWLVSEGLLKSERS